MSLILPLLAVLVGLAGLPETSKISLVAGGGNGGDGGTALQARLIEPFGVGFDSAGNLYIVEMEGGERVRRVDRRGIITTVTGNGTKGFSGDGGPAHQAQISGAHHLLVLPTGDIFIADTENHRVRFIDARTQQITTLAGAAEQGFAGEGGPATQAQLGGIYCLALSPKKDRLFLCDLDNRRIRVLDRKTGAITTVAGNGQRGIPSDGTLATQAPLVDPRAIAVDSQGNLYILERGGNALRVVNRAGQIRTLIGAPNHPAPADIGDLNGPKHLCVDRRDNLFIADTENHRILRYDPRSGRLEKVAGSGRPPASGSSPTADLGGSALDVHLNQPHGVFVHRDGSLYIADSSNGRIVRIRP